MIKGFKPMSKNVVAVLLEEIAMRDELLKQKDEEIRCLKNIRHGLIEQIMKNTADVEDELEDLSTEEDEVDEVVIADPLNSSAELSYMVDLKEDDLFAVDLVDEEIKELMKIGREPEELSEEELCEEISSLNKEISKKEVNILQNKKPTNIISDRDDENIRLHELRKKKNKCNAVLTEKQLKTLSKVNTKKITKKSTVVDDEIEIDLDEIDLDEIDFDENDFKIPTFKSRNFEKKQLVKTNQKKWEWSDDVLDSVLN